MRQTLLALLLAALLALAGCGSGGADEPGFSKDDLLLNIGGEPYRLSENIEAVIDRLGADYAYSDGISCAYDGLDKTYAYAAAIFFTNPLSDGDMVCEIYTEDPGVTTSKGLAVGVAKADVLAAYGEPAEDTGYQVIYRLAQPDRGALFFDIANETVTAFYVSLETI